MTKTDPRTTGVAVANSAELARWSGETGHAWVTHQRALDATHARPLELLLTEAGLAPGERVLDIGCGSGASSLAAAKAVAPSGHVDGLDISTPLLALARTRANEVDHPISFHLGDAQTAALAEASYAHVISRYGVMFFADPVGAFANILHALKPGGGATFLAWGPLEHNPWFAVARAAAVARLGAPAPRDPHAPGPLAFADPDRAAGLLRAGGFSVDLAEWRDLCLTPPGSRKAAADLAFRFGPAGRILDERRGGDADADAIRQSIADRFADFERPSSLEIPARLVLLRAHRP
ncbi:MAG: methyltransferase domain-containing protein [Pseudomonadota bacterium]